VERQLEGDLVDQDPPVAAPGFEVLELPLDDCVVVGDQVVDIAGSGRVVQCHRGASLRQEGFMSTRTV
jgi:hypothetical protein